MDLPKTFGELAIWSLMQFPVLAVAAGIAWWVNREARRQYTLLFGQFREVNAALLGERDKRIEERDRRIAELQMEIIELKAKLTRTKKPQEGEK